MSLEKIEKVKHASAISITCWKSKIDVSKVESPNKTLVGGAAPPTNAVQAGIACLTTIREKFVEV